MKKIFLPVLTMGASAMLLQIAALRQLLSAFSGNELDIGITLAVWLLAVGAGSFAGHRLRGGTLFAWSFIGVGMLSQSAVVTAEMIGPLFLTNFGETISLPATILLTAISLITLCFTIGMQFPLAVSRGNLNPATVYGLDTAGAFFAGLLFTFVFAGRADMRTLATGVGIMNIATGILLLGRKYLIPLSILPLVVYAASEKIDDWSPGSGTETNSGLITVERSESRYGEIRIMKLGDQLSLYSSGKLQFSYPDSQTEELRAHIPMAIHSSPRRVLVIGGSPAVLRELMKYPVSHIDFVEADPAMIAASFRLVNREDAAILKDPRLKTITEDAGKFIKDIRTPAYDLIVSNLPEPSTANLNRFYTTGFFKEAGRALNKDGILCLSLPVSSGYIGRRMLYANGPVYNSLRASFKNVHVSSEEYGYLFASDRQFDTRSEILRERFRERNIATEYFRDYLFDDIFAPMKMQRVEKRLRSARQINSDARPVSYLYNLMLWAEINKGKLFNSLLDAGGNLIAAIAAALFLVSTIFLAKRGKTVYYAMFTTGYSAMSFSLLVILSYQSAYGHVYETIGLLTGSFMLGTAMGAPAVRNSSNPMRTLLVAEILTVLLFISSLWLLMSELSYYAANIVCGILTGIEFSAAANYLGNRESTAVAGKVYAADMTGSFLGSLFGAIMFVPMLGVQHMLLFLVCLKMMSFISLVTVRR